MRGEENKTKDGRVVVAIFKTMLIFFERRAWFKRYQIRLDMKLKQLGFLAKKIKILNFKTDLIVNLLTAKPHYSLFSFGNVYNGNKKHQTINNKSISQTIY